MTSSLIFNPGSESMSHEIAPEEGSPAKIEALDLTDIQVGQRILKWC